MLKTISLNSPNLERNPPIDQVLKSGVVPYLVQYLTRVDNAKLQFEAAWCLTNIASGNSEHVAFLVNHNAVPIFVTLMASQDEELREQATWAIGNIAGDGAKFRDLVLHNGVMNPLLQILVSPTAKTSMLRNATWTLSNLCRGRPSPRFADIAPSLPVLARLIHSSDNEVVIDASWALSYISDGSEENIQAVIDSGITSKMVQLLGHSNTSIQTPALRTVGNIVTGSDSQTQHMLDLGILPYLYQLLSSPRKSLRKESCWTVSNITAGNAQQTQLAINTNIVPQLIKLMTSGEFEVKKEAAWALSNATTWKQTDQIRYLVQAGCIKPFVDLLTVKDSKLIGVTLEAIENILYTGERLSKANGINPFLSIVEEAEGIDRLEELQQHENEDIYKKAVRILENYFSAGEEDENMAPNYANNNQTFAFNSNVQVPTGGFAF